MIVFRSVIIRRPYLQAIGMLIAAIVASASLLAAMMQSTQPGFYTYSKTKASNGITLYVAATTPEHIRLEAIAGNLAKLPYHGINGGFFYESNLLSIAAMNDIPAKGEPQSYGSGWYNEIYKRGTLVWDGALRRFSVQVAGSVDELWMANRRNYWAQGGVSMNLGDEYGWRSEAELEHMPALDENRMRSAIAYDNKNRVWLVVSPTLCTIADFRAAILEKLGPQGIVDGVFLDGDGSSQMKVARKTLPGDNREVYQIIRLVP